MFVINYWKDGRRHFKVFECPCVPLYENEEVTGLQCAIAWRPEGNMIANPVCVNGENTMVVFEKNGYKRFHFPLLHGQLEIKELKWSAAGEVLAVLQKKGENESLLCLYVTSNYKWFLKQSFVLRDVVSFNWSSSGLILRIFTQREMLSFDFKNEFSLRGSDCAVIDGKNVGFTSFKDACLPPPLSQNIFEARNGVNQVVFDEKSKVAIIESTNNITVLDYINGEVQMNTALEIPSETDSFLYHFHWFEADLFCVESSAHGEFLVHFRNNGVFSKQKVDSGILEVVGVPELKARLYQIGNRVLLKNETTILSVDYQVPPLHIQHRIVTSKPHIFTLTTSNAFYVNDQLLANNVTSFALFQSYLLLTTTKNSLICSSLSKISLNNAHSRPTERGASIICGIPSTSLIVLEIARGNLEIISCRLIAIDILENLLQAGQWRKALGFIRTDRLNYNLLIDLNGSRFLENVGRFVEACETPAVLSAFVQEIEDANVLQTIYCNIRTTSDRLPEKRRIVFDSILAYLESVDYTVYIVPIVIICVYHCTIEKALVYVQDLLENPAIAAEAVRTLIVHTKGEDLFQTSLRLYDTKLTRYISSFTQMDPKSYLPFLDELDGLSEVRRRFKINVRLNRPDLAVKYLLRDDGVSDEEIIEFVRCYSVSRIAYDHVKSDTILFREISILYAKSLSEKKAHQEAAVILSRAELWEDAYRESLKCSDRLRALSAVEKLEKEPLERHRLIEELVEVLTRERRYKEAADICENYLGNYEKAVKVLITGYCFKEAIFLAEKHKRRDILIHDILPSIEEHRQNCKKKVLEIRKTFHDYRMRLAKVRRTKVEKLSSNTTLFPDDNIEKDADLFSDAGTRSTQTSTSRSSTRSSKKRRKEERKKQNLREGGFYEDIALVRALHALTEDIFRTGQDVAEFCLVLVEHGMKRDAEGLHRQLKETQEEMRESFGEIWPECFVANYECRTVEERVINENVDALGESSCSVKETLGRFGFLLQMKNTGGRQRRVSSGNWRCFELKMSENMFCN